jgi:Sortase and related acyltransferases
MIGLRKCGLSDSEWIASRFHLPAEKAESLLAEWNAGSYQGSYFEMFAVQCDDTVVGTVSLYGHSQAIVSIGPEIFEEFRRRGFAKAAMTEAMRIARERGFEIVLQQVRTDNGASIRLHEALGFEKDNYTYTNRNGNEVFLYLKTIR